MSAPYAGSPSGSSFTVKSIKRSRLSPVRADTGTTSVHSSSAQYVSIKGSSRVLFTKSILLITRKTGRGRLPSASRTRSMAKRSPKPGGDMASTRTYSRSPSSKVSRAVRTIRRLSRCCGLCRPGVSRKAISAPGTCAMPKIRVLVVCGLSDTIAIFSFRSRLSSVDFPTFDRPTMETVPDFMSCKEQPAASGEGLKISALCCSLFAVRCWLIRKLIDRLALPHESQLLSRQFFDPGRIVLRAFDLQPQRGVAPLQNLDVLFQLTSMLSHRPILDEPHVAEQKRTGQPEPEHHTEKFHHPDRAPLPGQRIRPSVRLNQHDIPRGLRGVQRPPTGRDTPPSFPVPLRCAAVGYTWPPGRSWRGSRF